jgi:4'-phosphopantetheinyl transferase
MPETKTVWSPPAARPRLAAGVADVWRADLAAGGERERALLSAAERERAECFARAEHGRRWAHARGILRALLGAYGEVDPLGLRFAEGPHGKPALTGAAGALSRVRFNLSHSGDVALYAFALDREVGVDVELPRRSVDAVAIAERVLGAGVAARLRTLDPPAREREFLRAWVRWEAALKCRGTGIGGEREATGPEPWLHQLDLGHAGAAALAVGEGPCEVRCWQWTAAAG